MGNTHIVESPTIIADNSHPDQTDPAWRDDDATILLNTQDATKVNTHNDAKGIQAPRASIAAPLTVPLVKK